MKTRGLLRIYLRGWKKKERSSRVWNKSKLVCINYVNSAGGGEVLVKWNKAVARREEWSLPIFLTVIID